jgi:hypothetical protein
MRPVDHIWRCLSLLGSAFVDTISLGRFQDNLTTRFNANSSGICGKLEFMIPAQNYHALFFSEMTDSPPAITWLGDLTAFQLAD